MRKTKSKSETKAKVEGSYFIRAKASGKWYVYHQIYEDGKPVQKSLPQPSYLALGFESHWPIIKAKAYCKELNKSRSIEKQTIRRAAQKSQAIVSENEDYFPQHLVALFCKKLEEENQGSEEHLKKIFSHFYFVQKMCIAAKLMPSEYRDSQKKFYNFFVSKKISVNYSKRLIAMLNQWGSFHSRYNNRFYEEVQTIKGQTRRRIADAQVTKSGIETRLGVREESVPLTEADLKKIKDKIPETLYNWLHLSVFLGLRPEEVDGLHDEKRFKVEKRDDLLVLWVFQTKLKSVEKEKCWKAIPLILDEQVQCLTIIGQGNFKKCSYKYARKVLPKGVTFYGGRKNFIDMMLMNYSQKLEDISNWLGHTSIDMSWKHYRNKKAIHFIPIRKLAVAK